MLSQGFPVWPPLRKRESRMDPAGPWPDPLQAQGSSNRRAQVQEVRDGQLVGSKGERGEVGGQNRKTPIWSAEWCSPSLSRAALLTAPMVLLNPDYGSQLRTQLRAFGGSDTRQMHQW
ncbi:hypothetical protein NDU88_007471 [Pleurodeles waltl]|uniref:Uncharacterized protein n=1 Tax=Pleurodeles waltl TaxID=8319 RepID=A0AAV7N272_PLEWA|nr:hypothetical protein NDU88_007471 [Pleurodeles waltl]